jgi:30S ribosomal protein S31
MGKGDRRTKRGKIHRGTYGRRRKRKKVKTEEKD